MDSNTFASTVEELAYWRKMAEEYKQGMDEVREELEEFQTNSRELEMELETQLRQLETQNRELLVLTEKLTAERDLYRERADKGHHSLSHEVTQLQEELQRYKTENDKQQRYIRELEQFNDDLERSKRAAVVTLEDFEAQLNKAIERNAILENELDEKEDLIVTVQRLKEETRDLHQELAITRRHELSHVDVRSPHHTASKEVPVQTESTQLPTSPLSPCIRAAALNMVNDALYKIGQLEFRLSELYRSYGTVPLSAPPVSSHNRLSAKGNSLVISRHRQSSKTWTNGSLLLDSIPVAQDTTENSVLLTN